MPDTWAHEKEKRKQTAQDQHVNNRNRSATALGELLNPRDCRIYQICEEDCKEESNQGPAGDVKESDTKREQQHREKDSSCPRINERHQLFQ